MDQTECTVPYGETRFLGIATYDWLLCELAMMIMVCLSVSLLVTRPFLVFFSM